MTRFATRRHASIHATMTATIVAMLLAMMSVCVAPETVGQTLRGVDPQFVHRYLSHTGDNGELLFQCHGTHEYIPFSALNDDYCDCDDGSDEPGTAACSLVNSSGIGFYCPNVGFDPRHIPSRMVNDGHCDYSICCDGSDEWSGLVECPDHCQELGRARIKKREEAVNEYKAGAALKASFIQKGGAKIKQRVVDAEAKKAELQKLDAKIADLTPRLEELRSLEELMPPGKSKRNTARQRRANRKRSKTSNTDDNSLLEDIGELAINILGYVWEKVEDILDYVGLQSKDEEYFDSDVSDSYEDGNSASSEDGESHEGGEGDAEIKETAEEKEARVNEEKRLATLRDELDELSEQVDGLEADKRSLTSDLEKLEEPVDEFFEINLALYSLDGECFEIEYDDFSYEACLFEKAYQKEGNNRRPKSGTVVGRYDQVIRTDNGYLIHFEDGSKCWNGPNRSFHLTLECGTKNEMTYVREASKCYYEALLKTPVACDEDILNLDISSLSGEEIDKRFGLE